MSGAKNWHNMEGWPFVAVRFVTHNLLRAVSPLLGASFCRSSEWTVPPVRWIPVGGWLKGNAPTVATWSSRNSPRESLYHTPQKPPGVIFLGKGAVEAGPLPIGICIYHRWMIDIWPLYEYTSDIDILLLLNKSKSKYAKPPGRPHSIHEGFQEGRCSLPIIFQKCICFQVSSPDGLYFRMSCHD